MAETLEADYGIPADLDQLDGGGAGTVYMLAAEIDVDEEDGEGTAATWYAPIGAAGVTCIAKAYRVSDQVEVATSDGAGFTPTSSVVNTIPFVTPFTPVAGVRYAVAILTRRYTYTLTAAFPFDSDPAGVMHAYRGRLKVTTAGNPVFPDTESTTNFHIGMVFERAAQPIEGEGALVAPAATAAGTGVVVNPATAALGASAAVLAGEGAVVNPAAGSAVLSGSTVSGAGVVVNPGAGELVAPMPVIAGNDVLDAPGTHTAGGTSATLTAGGTSATLTASGTP